MISHFGLLFLIMRVLCLEIMDLTYIAHAAIIDLDCVPVENII